MYIKEKDNKLNISFEKDNNNNIQLWKDIYGSHVKVGSHVYGDFPEITKIEDYLYEIIVDEIDEKYFLQEEKNPYIAGACSQFRKDNIIGRNYDWTYSDDVEFIVRTLPKEGRFASIGVANSEMTKEQIESGEYSEKFKLAICHLLDGINECGVYCASNVVPVGDKGITKGTQPGAKPLPCIGVPRFILDNAKSAKHAIELLETRNIYGVIYDDLTVVELHYLICDTNDTFIVELVNNKLSVLPFEDKKAAMTNFYLTDWNNEVKAKWLGNTDEEIAETGLTAHADGLERMLIIQSNIDDVDSEEAARELLKKIKYTNAYNEEMNPFWYSELTGKYSEGELTIYSDEEKFALAKEIFIEQFRTRDRKGSPSWQTVHSTVYNIIDKTFKIIVQEGETEHEYILQVNN